MRSELTGVSCAGLSIMEMLEEELDDQVEVLLECTDTLSAEKLLEAKHFAAGFAWAMSFLRNPYDPDVALIEIKAASMRRIQTLQEERNAHQEDSQFRSE